MTAAPLAQLTMPLSLFRTWPNASALLALTVLIALAALPILAAHLLDTRIVSDEAVWLKPLKFHAALAIYLLTLAYFARWLPDTWVTSRGWSIYLGVVMTCIVLELIWIDGAAALGVRSHFNITSPLWNAIYGAMGIAAVTLTSAALVMGIGIWRNAATGLPAALQLSIALGLILTFVLTVPVAGTMANALSHHVGTPITGATLPIMGWSREVGDLRAPHFLATHALHAVPLAGLAALALPASWQTPAVWAAAAGFAALTLWAFLRAMSGLPPL